MDLEFDPNWCMVRSSRGELICPGVKEGVCGGVCKSEINDAMFLQWVGRKSCESAWGVEQGVGSSCGFLKVWGGQIFFAFRIIAGWVCLDVVDVEVAAGNGGGGRVRKNEVWMYGACGGG